MTVSEEVPDVTILGAGIIGICCALSCIERGQSVEIIDRADPGMQTSSGNAGVISPWSCVPQCTPGVWKNIPKWLLDPAGPVKFRLRDLPSALPWVAAFLRNTTRQRVYRISDAMDGLMQGNVATYRNFLQGTGRDDLIVDTSLISIFRGPSTPDLSNIAWRLREDHGATVEALSASELRDLEPDISTEYTCAVRVPGQARATSPVTLCTVLAEKAARLGVRFRKLDVRALHPREDGSVDVETDSGSIATRKLVLSAGVWSRDLLRPLGIRLPLIAERGYHLQLANPGVRLENSIQDMAGKVVISSMEGAIRVAGTAELAAVDAPPNYRRADVLGPLVKRVLPRLNMTQARPWMGQRPSFPDNLPVIGRIPGHQNLIAAFGHSHYGLGMAPATGRLVADITSGAGPNIEMAPYAVDRF